MVAETVEQRFSASCKQMLVSFWAELAEDARLGEELVESRTSRIEHRFVVIYSRRPASFVSSHVLYR